MVSPPLVTLDEAIAHYRLQGTVDLADLELKLEACTELILERVKQRTSDVAAGSPPVTWAETVDGWAQDTVPKRVKMAILVMFGFTVAFRGDDPDSVMPNLSARNFGDLPDAVMNWIRPFIDPVLR